MTQHHTHIHAGGIFRSFKGRIVIIFSSLLAIILLSQVFYKLSLDSMHRALLSAVQTAEVIHAAENFHSATHSMLVLATSGNADDRVRSQPEYAKQRDVAKKMLEMLLTMTDKDDSAKPSATSGREIVAGMSVTFELFFAATDSLISTEGFSRETARARSLFDEIFSSYTELLHQYHDNKLEGLKENAHKIDQWTSVLFIFQLCLVIIVGLLLAIFSVRVLVRPYERAEQLSLSDGLTGLRNRRYLETFALPEMEDNIRKRAVFTICLMDIDKFKNFNDSYGHQSGDELLVEIARILVSLVRESDSVIRFGGEEFLIFLPGTNKEHAILVVEKIRASIEAFSFRLSGNAEKLGATASFGIASFPDDGSKVQKMIGVADERLYQAKNAGRNRVQS